jgi:hypothetical protein
LVQTNQVVDAEDVLSGNIQDEAANVSDVEVPQSEISDIDVTEESEISDSDFSIITSDEDMDEVSVAADTNVDKEEAA